MSQGSTVLASSYSSTEPFNINKRLYPFRGYDGEDFIEFKNNLEDYFALKNITEDKQKVMSFKALLTGKARADFDTLYPSAEEAISNDYQSVIGVFTSKYFTEEMQEQRKDAFNGISQLEDESPINVLNRLTEAAVVAGITDETTITSRFKYGLLFAIQEHCVCTGARTHEDYVRLAQGYWNGY
ncbi:uncharacterized protein EV154DRAFT_429896, partial [Mucor mucedo]|uniref:uncharacterized protein n=1 Tax=Mucor mucedo TaxID=29922 RepID=UPI0022200B53